MVFEVTDELFDIHEGRAGRIFDGFNFFEDFCDEGILRSRCGRSGGLEIFDGFWGSDDKRGGLQKMIETNTSQALKDEVGSSVWLQNAGTDQAEASDVWAVSGGSGLTGDGEHPGSFERLLEHSAVSGFEDMKGKKVVGEENGLREDHDTNLLGQIHQLSIHWKKKVGKGKIRPFGD